MKPRPTTHCLRGHDLTGANLYVNPKGVRFCRVCRRISERNRQKPIKYDASTTVASRPSDELIAEAQRRAMAPRDLTAMLLGDPPVGFSMLDRRGAL